MMAFLGLQDPTRGTTRKGSKKQGREQDAQELRESNILRLSARDSLAIDETTRGEILDILDLGQGRISRSGITKASSLFERAKKGTEPIFKSRMYIQEKIRMMKETPGRDQLVLTGRSPVATQAERVLVGDYSDLGGNR